MRNLLGHILLCLALVAGLCLPAAASPQKDGFDRALDKYEAICDRCLGLRMRVEAGEKVEMSALKALLSELSSLRRTLSGASGKMSAAQAERFRPSGQGTFPGWDRWEMHRMRALRKAR